MLALRRPQEGPLGWVTLFWLAEKQGRWILWPGLLVSFIAGFVSFLPPDLMWLSATLIIGLVCGGAVFGPEQAGEQDRFLGAQRLPPGQVWLVKTVFWMLGAIGMTCLFGLATVWRLKNRDYYGEAPEVFLRDLVRENLPLFLTLAVSHGFCIGQFCSFLSRKSVVVAFLGVAVSLILFVLWLPSLVFGGVHAWQILGVPLILLIAARLSMWPWYSGRMYMRRHFAGLAACMFCVIVWLSGSLWYRVVEVPDVGEPFDLQAFETKLEKARYSPAVLLINKGILAMETRIRKIDSEWPPFTKELVFSDLDKLDKRETNSEIPNGLIPACNQVCNAGEWPTEDDELGPRLNAFFEGEWAGDLRTAAKMALGLNEKKGTSSSVRTLLPARFLQLQAQKDFRGSLDDLEICLGLGRQFQNYGPESKYLANASAYQMGLSLERYGLHGLDEWLSTVGPRVDLLQAALKALQDHEKESPDPVDNIKADYVALKNYVFSAYPPPGAKAILGPIGTSDAFLRNLLFACPWEEARRQRILNALYLGQMAKAKLTPTEWSNMELKERTGFSWRTGIRLDSGASSANIWGPVLKNSTIPFDRFLPAWPHDMPRYLRHVRFRQVAIGLMLFQAEEGHAAAKLDDLVPRYLPALPLDPWLNEPFDYRVSHGEDLGYLHTSIDNAENIKLVAGQGFLTIDERNLFPGFANSQVQWLPSYFAVPVWSKEKK